MFFHIKVPKWQGLYGDHVIVHVTPMALPLPKNHRKAQKDHDLGKQSF